MVEHEEVRYMVRVLLVANKTLGSAEVAEFVRSRMATEDCRFTLLVPATPRGDRQPGFRLAGRLAAATEGVGAAQDTADDYENARARLEYGLGVLRSLGANVDGEIGDPDPARAVAEALQRGHVDEVALSTLPKGVSRWLHLDIPRQVERRFHLPVTVVKVARVPVPARSETT